jgi:hypothetical protein
MANDDLVVYEVERNTDDKTDSISNGTVHNETGSVTHAEIQREHPGVASFDLDGKNGAVVQPIIEHGDDTHHGNVAAEFLKWHHRLGHISPCKIQLMAKEGRLPAKLASCNILMCTSCMYGKATKRPWRSKAPPNRIKSICTFPGQCVSVDQLESSTPGLIAQLRGIPTHRQYRVATVFVDHYSGLGYVHLQQSTSALETIEAKSAFERFAMEQGASVSHYHADNGCFADNLFRQAVREKQQVLTFCGVNAHFQNGVAERRIRELQDHARTMLIHSSTRWPDAINAHLWPYALRTANDIMNATVNLKTKQVPIEMFTNSRIRTNLQHWYHFGCPVYVLDSDLQAGRKIDKWDNRSRVAVYLGRSPNHARTVALCLSLKTGNVSPQFHFQVHRFRSRNGKPSVTLYSTQQRGGSSHRWFKQ